MSSKCGGTQFFLKKKTETKKIETLLELREEKTKEEKGVYGMKN